MINSGASSIYDSGKSGLHTPTETGWYDINIYAWDWTGGKGPKAGYFGFAYSTTDLATKSVKISTSDTNWHLVSDPGDKSFLRYDDGRGFEDALTIIGDPKNIGTVSPAYGTKAENVNGSTFECSATSPIVIDGTTWEIAGYDVYDIDITTGERTGKVEALSGSGSSFTYTHGTTMRELVWKWVQTKHTISVEDAMSEMGSVTGAGEYGAGAQVTLSATAAENYSFVKWTGNLPSGINASSATITFTADASYTLRPQFAVMIAVSPEDGDTAVADAVSAANAGDIIVLAEGIYEVSAEILINKDITLRGAGRDKTTIKVPKQESANRVINLNSANAVVEGVTLSGGTSGEDGVVAYINAGTMQDCTIRDGIKKSWSGNGGAVYVKGTGKLLRSIIFNNSALWVGNGAALTLADNAVAESCLITANLHESRTNNGQMVSVNGNAILRNCTVVDNVSFNSHSGIYINSANCIVTNCISWGNEAKNSPAYGDEQISASQASFLNRAMNCYTNDPHFADYLNGDYRLASGSPSINMGAVSMGEFASETDLDGTSRMKDGAADLGCYEFAAPSAFAVAFAADCYKSITGKPVQFTSYVANGTGTLSYLWNFGDNTTSTEANPSHIYQEGGIYDISLTVTDSTGAFVTKTMVDRLNIAPETIFVEVGESIDDAIALANDGSTIVLKRGEHIDNRTVAHQIYVEKDITIIGETDNPLDTRIVSTGANNVTRTSFTLNHPNAVVSSLTVMGYQDTDQKSGGAIKILTMGGTVTNVVVTGNKASAWQTHGAGIKMAAGLVTHCVITNNTATAIHDDDKSGGLGLYITGGTAVNCLIADNSLSGSTPATGPGGAVRLENGKLINCTIAGNSLYQCSGVYAKSGEVINCVIAGNVSTVGGEDAKRLQVWAGEASCFKSCAADNGIVINESCKAEPGDFIYKSTASRNYQLGVGSVAIDAGDQASAALAGCRDLIGNARISNNLIDIGCYELDLASLPLTVTLSSNKNEGLSPIVVTLTASVAGNKGAVSYEWDTDGGTIIDKGTSADKTATIRYDAIGRFNPSVTVTDSSDGSTKEGLLATPVRSVPKTIYVNADNNVENGAGREPYNEETIGAGTIREAVDYAIDGCEIILLPGYHKIAGNQSASVSIDVTKAITIRSKDGKPEGTVVALCPKYTASAGIAYIYNRCFTLNNPNALITGIAMQDGFLAQHAYGGIISIEANGGTVSNCVMRNTVASGWEIAGSVVYLNSPNGVVSHCVISNSSMTARTAKKSGAVNMTGGKIENCLISDCRANGENDDYYQATGLVMVGGMASFCTITDCEGVYAAGVSITSDATMENCLVVGNTVSREDGHADIMTDGKSALEAGTRFDNVTYTAYSDESLSEIIGTGSLLVTTNEVRFAAPGKENYKLKAKSVLRNKGFDDGTLDGKTDLTGASRKLGIAPEMGCYELTRDLGTMMIVR